MDHFVLVAFLVISLTMISAQLLGGAESIDDLMQWWPLLMRQCSILIDKILRAQKN